MSIIPPFITRNADRMALGWGAVIAILSLSPLPELPEMAGGDKLHHFAAYALFALLSMLSRKTHRGILITLLIIITYGGLIELLQPYINRYRELGDFLANSAGAFTGCVIAYFFRYSAESP